MQKSAVPRLYNASNKRNCIIPNPSRVVSNNFAATLQTALRPFIVGRSRCSCCSGLRRVGGLALIVPDDLSLRSTPLKCTCPAKWRSAPDSAASHPTTRKNKTARAGTPTLRRVGGLPPQHTQKRRALRTPASPSWEIFGSKLLAFSLDQPEVVKREPQLAFISVIFDSQITYLPTYPLRKLPTGWREARCCSCAGIPLAGRSDQRCARRPR